MARAALNGKTTSEAIADAAGASADGVDGALAPDEMAALIAALVAQEQQGQAASRRRAAGAGVQEEGSRWRLAGRRAALG